MIDMFFKYFIVPRAVKYNHKRGYHKLERDSLKSLTLHELLFLEVTSEESLFFKSLP